MSSATAGIHCTISLLALSDAMEDCSLFRCIIVTYKLSLYACVLPFFVLIIQIKSNQIIYLSQATWPIHRHSHTRTQYTMIQKKKN